MNENGNTLPGEKGNGTMTAKPFCVALGLTVQLPLFPPVATPVVPLALNGKYLEVKCKRSLHPTCTAFYLLFSMQSITTMGLSFCMCVSLIC